MGQGLPIRVQIFTAFVALTGLALLGLLIAGEESCRGVLAGTAFFIIQIVITGSYPLPVAPRATTDVSTAVLFGRALVVLQWLPLWRGVVLLLDTKTPGILAQP